MDLSIQIKRNKCICAQCLQLRSRDALCELVSTPSVLYFEIFELCRLQGFVVEPMLTIGNERYGLVSIVYCNGTHYWGDHLRITGDRNNERQWIRVDDMNLNPKPGRTFSHHTPTKSVELQHLHALTYVKFEAHGKSASSPSNGVSTLIPHTEEHTNIGASVTLPKNKEVRRDQFKRHRHDESSASLMQAHRDKVPRHSPQSSTTSKPRTRKRTAASPESKVNPTLHPRFVAAVVYAWYSYRIHVVLF